VAADLDLFRRLAAAERHLVVVATTRSDGSVHASVVNAGVLPHPTDGDDVVGMVVAGGARKLSLLRASGQATVTVRSGWEWASVDGPVDLAGPDDALPGLDNGGLPELLRAVFRGAGGTHEDWDEFDRVMAAERRAAVLVRPTRTVSVGR
jgi:PPOX class probable F420-dependent enzyme